ncbi:hypothetical protein KUTeg_010233 [Tegillarca granosa]|uniref:Uncharacterized protein n=1 Tax=Tegillarca granosa TaxID=220873 RepID=A0ABQ9F648_TEGGR|nr:hypothetical protein KUTeg_010233 [Tegillarca granosa]
MDNSKILSKVKVIHLPLFEKKKNLNQRNKEETKKCVYYCIITWLSDCLMLYTYQKRRGGSILYKTNIDSHIDGFLIELNLIYWYSNIKKCKRKGRNCKTKIFYKIIPSLFNIIIPSFEAEINPSFETGSSVSFKKKK